MLIDGRAGQAAHLDQMLAIVVPDRIERPRRRNADQQPAPCREKAPVSAFGAPVERRSIDGRAITAECTVEHFGLHRHIRCEIGRALQHPPEPK